MRDIPEDILRSAYQIVVGTKFKGTNRDIAVLAVAQAIQSERDRAFAHVTAAQEALGASGNGSASHLRLAASAILSNLANAIILGDGL